MLLIQDLLYGLAKHSDAPLFPGELPKPSGTLGIFGTPTGATLRSQLKALRRPLVWADGFDTPPLMLIDPAVGGIGGGRIQPADVALWDRFWANASAGPRGKPAEQAVRFLALALAMPKRLHFRFPSWATPGYVGCAWEGVCAPLGFIW